LGHYYVGIGNLNQEAHIEVDDRESPIIMPPQETLDYILNDNIYLACDSYPSAKKRLFIEIQKTRLFRHFDLFFHQHQPAATFDLPII
jgi:hypothetical protein